MDLYKFIVEVVSLNIRNAQGDITGLFDKNGTTVVEYTYDSWGKLITTTGSFASTVGAKNPYRYRGYRYDTETGLYYLQSRYYNPTWGRFINADGLLGNLGELLSFNLFTYCSNNQVNGVDPSGKSWLGAIALAIGTTCTLPAVVATVITYAVVAVAVLTIVAIADVAIQEYRKHHVNYYESSSNTRGEVSDDTSNPISDGMEERIPNSELNPPNKRGDKPISKKDGKSIEIHHKDQNPDGPFEELLRTDHRLGKNYRKNHPKFKEKSKINRDKFAKDVKRYWKREWDSGRWN